MALARAMLDEVILWRTPMFLARIDIPGSGSFLAAGKTEEEASVALRAALERWGSQRDLPPGWFMDGKAAPGDSSEIGFSLSGRRSPSSAETGKR
jgi:hypothetical protein